MRDVDQIRKEISNAKAELERIKEKKKITKKGKKNRKLLEKECKTISAATLVGYMEKKKSALRKLKNGSTEEKSKNSLVRSIADLNVIRDRYIQSLTRW